tara:strand:- start:15766 stop:16638 length:873 start_codon:yes stop_codon:yes gene_type:complete
MNTPIPHLLGTAAAGILIAGLAYSSVDDSAHAAVWPADTHIDSHVAVTLPSRQVRLAGARAGRIANIHVELGAMVEKGQVLFELENDVERLDYERLRLGASGRAAIALATARLQKAKAAAARIAELSDRDIASGANKEEAVANQQIATAELARAREQQALLALERDQALAQFELMRGRSPFDGRVEQIHHDVGESVDHLEPVLRLVALQPLFVEFPCPVGQREHWQAGAVAEVSEAGSPTTARAVVVFCGQQTDIASQTVTVRLQLANEHGNWLAGRRVNVRRMQSKKGK